MASTSGWLHASASSSLPSAPMQRICRSPGVSFNAIIASRQQQRAQSPTRQQRRRRFDAAAADPAKELEDTPPVQRREFAPWSRGIKHDATEIVGHTPLVSCARLSSYRLVCTCLLMCHPSNHPCPGAAQ